MRLSGLSLLALFACACSPVGCAQSVQQLPEAIATVVNGPQEPDMTGIIRLIGRFGIAHGCPVGPDLALTAAHVVDLKPFDMSAKTWPMLWSDRNGNYGMVLASALGDTRDLAVLRTSEPFPAPYAIIKTAPEVGMVVWLQGYDMRRAKDAYSPRVFSTKVIAVISGHVFLQQAGTPGSSGSCVLNAAGEVVAINIGGTTLDNGEQIGVAVGAWPAVLNLAG